MGNKIDITSTVLEKTVDTAKDFLGKFIGPTVEEVGLLIKDRVAFWRFRNQVTMLNKAKEYCRRNNIKTKTISLKQVCPLLDYASLEENETLQDKWAILLSNMIDSEQNIENHVFPYILSQLSINEFTLLEKVYDDHLVKQELLKTELNLFLLEKESEEEEIHQKIKTIKERVKTLDRHADDYYDQLMPLENEARSLNNRLNELHDRSMNMAYELERKAALPEEDLKPFELANVIRLGLVKEEKDFYTNPTSINLPGRSLTFGPKSLNLDIPVESTVENVITELGELFLKACKEKQPANGD